MQRWILLTNQKLWTMNYKLWTKIFTFVRYKWIGMTANEKTLATFETRLRQMILRFQELKKENQELYDMVSKNEQDINQLRAKLEQQQSDYQSLKMAKMIEISDGDLSGAKERLSKLIRDVNKCIAILSDENQ